MNHLSFKLERKRRLDLRASIVILCMDHWAIGQMITPFSSVLIRTAPGDGAGESKYRYGYCPWTSGGGRKNFRADKRKRRKWWLGMSPLVRVRERDIQTEGSRVS